MFYQIRHCQLRSLLIGALVVASLTSSFAQTKSNPKPASDFGWDLTYTKILATNRIGQENWIHKWLKTYNKSPARGWLANWKGEPIVSAVLIEHPAFHAGERTTMWFFRTKSAAQYWVSVQEEDDSIKEIAADSHRFALTPATYDIFLKTITTWQQKNPPKPETLPDQAIPGYMGIISIYSDGVARQVLVTFEDFFFCETKECPEPKPGRLSCAITPVLFDSEKGNCHQTIRPNALKRTNTAADR